MMARSTAAELSIDDAIGLFLDGLVDKGLRETSAITQGYQLRRFFRSVLGDPLHTLTKERMQQLDAELIAGRSRKTLAPLAAETVTLGRTVARRFTRWCAAQGRLSADPLARDPKKTVVRLRDEVSQLRADLEALRQECDQLRQQLHSPGGAR